MFDCLLFDLDGTLTDPFEGITNSVVYALEKFGIEVEDRRELIKFIGPPLVRSFSEYYGLSGEDALKAVDYYREYFSDRGIFENAVYDGVYELLSLLKARGKRLIMATSKPEIFAERIAERFSLSQYFDAIAGATMDCSRIEKTDVVRYALNLARIEDKSRALMIGDRRHDVIGAKDNGLKALGVLYGYGNRAELMEAGADFLADSPHDILRFIDRVG